MSRRRLHPRSGAGHVRTRRLPAKLVGLLEPVSPAAAGKREAERRLLSAARSGDRRATEALLRSLSGTVFRFGQSFCRNPDDAEDLMQDVLRSLLVTLPAFRGDSSLSTWAFTVARRACARHKRRLARTAPLGDGDTPDDRPDSAAGPAEEAERSDVRRAIHGAIAELPPAHREVVILRDVEGLPASEVARVLGIGERAVKSRLHRARLALRDRLSAYTERPARRRRAALVEASRRSAGPGPPPRRCPDTARLLSRYLEGELDAGVCDALAAHVAECPKCGAACESIRTVLGACRAWGAKPLAAAERARLRAAIRTAIASSSASAVSSGT
jgi:RNA polymerase sigma-70 factor, ECF subfamily